MASHLRLPSHRPFLPPNYVAMPPPSPLLYLAILEPGSSNPRLAGLAVWQTSVASNIPDAGKAGHAASSVHGAASSPGCRGASLRHEIVRDRGPGRGRVRNVCIG